MEREGVHTAGVEPIQGDVRIRRPLALNLSHGSGEAQRT